MMETMIPSPQMKVTTEEFILKGTELEHVPTGATFWLDDKDVVCCRQGHLHLGTRELDELKEVAWEIMTFERKSCV